MPPPQYVQNIRVQNIHQWSPAPQHQVQQQQISQQPQPQAQPQGQGQCQQQPQPQQSQPSPVQQQSQIPTMPQSQTQNHPHPHPQQQQPQTQQQLAWSQGPRHYIQLDAKTHAQLQQMDPQQRALFLQRLQRQRQFIMQQQQQQQHHQQQRFIIRSSNPMPAGLNPQQQLQWLQQQGVRPQTILLQQTIPVSSKSMINSHFQLYSDNSFKT